MNTTQQQPVIPQPAISTGSMLTQVSGVLAAIIILILACAWVAKRLGFAFTTQRQSDTEYQCKLLAGPT